MLKIVPLWEGSILKQNRKEQFKWILLIILMSFTLILILFSGADYIFAEDFAVRLVIHIIGYFLLILIIIVAIHVLLVSLYGPQFILTPEALILKKRIFGVPRTKTIELKRVQQVYREKEDPFLENSYYFFSKKFGNEEELSSDYREFNLLFFQVVDSPEDLLAALQSVIPLIPHPTMKNVYNRM